MGVDFGRTSRRCYLKYELISKDDPPHPNTDVEASSMVAEALKSDEKCPELHGQVRLVENFPFTIYCKLALLGDNLPGSPKRVSSLAECAKRCVENAKCQGADYNYDSRACSLKVNYVRTPTTEKSHGIALVPLAQRGSYIVKDL
jgi:hypothetical protein